MSRILHLGRQTARTAPAEYRDAVAEYAREIGASGDIVWVDAPVNCWQIRLTLKPDDPRCRNRDGQNYETVELQEWVHPDPAHASYPRHDPALLKRLRRSPHTNRLVPGYVSLRLQDLGTSGVVEILQRGSLLTGRGEFQSAEEAMDAIRKRTRTRLDQNYDAQRNRSRDVARAVRRQVFKIPFLPVGIELRRQPAKEA